MHKISLKVDYQDERGQIIDLIVSDFDSVSRITFTSGAVRGNHLHKETTQWAYVVSGNLEGYGGSQEELETLNLVQGDFIVSYPNEAHAFRALEPSELLIFTKGPRSGKNYKEDTFTFKLI
jgi:quercetin dioxygenase-like cupin family protein